MSYTHYFAYRPQDEGWARAWPELLVDAQQFVDASTVQGHAIVGGTGVGRPEIGPDRIVLNGPTGRGGDALHLIGPDMAEATLVHPGPDGCTEVDDHVFMRCTTERMAYDGVVAAILLRAAQLHPRGFLFASDGGWDLEWEDGAREGLAARPLLRSTVGTDAMPGYAQEYFSGAHRAEDIFARARRVTAIRDIPDVEPVPLADVMFSDEPHLGF